MTDYHVCGTSGLRGANPEDGDFSEPVDVRRYMIILFYSVISAHVKKKPVCVHFVGIYWIFFANSKPDNKESATVVLCYSIKQGRYMFFSCLTRFTVSLNNAPYLLCVVCQTPLLIEFTYWTAGLWGSRRVIPRSTRWRVTRRLTS